MARPKSKFHKSDRRVTITDVLWNASREDIDNMSGFFDACLKNHIRCRIKNDPDFKRFLYEKYGDDLIFIIRSSKPGTKAPAYVDPLTPSLSDEEYDAALEEM